MFVGLERILKGFVRDNENEVEWNEMEKKIFLKFLEGGFGILDLRGKIVNSGLVWIGLR